MGDNNSEKKAASLTANKNEADETFDFDAEFEKKIKLSDDSEEYIYSRGPKYSDELWPIQCFLCRIGRIVNEKRFQTHTKHPKHVENLENAIKEPPNAEEFRQPYEQIYSDRMQTLKNPIKIYPGETIAELTSDYADRLIKIKDFVWDMPPAEGYLEILKSDIIMDFNKKSPLLGLCYGFKMVKDKKIAYYCSLCETDLTELNAYQHFNGKEHFNLYVEKHFEETTKKLSEITGITEDQKATIIRSIYQKLENWKGTRPFYLINGKAFAAVKDRFTQRAKRIYHYCDTTIVFSDSELKDMFEKIKKRQMIVPTNPERLTKQPKTEKDLTELPADVEEELPNIEEIVKSDRANSARPQKSRKRRNKNRNRNRKDETEKKAKIDSDAEERKRPRKLKLDETPANWEKYRNLCQRAIQSLNNEYERFAMVSERHPKYKEEWTRYWRNKTEELRRERINPNNYNYMPEWNEYWMHYLKQCFQKDATKCKFEFRKNLKLPFRGSTPEPPNIFEGCKFGSNTDGGTNTNKTQSGPVPLMSVGSIFGGIDGGNKNQSPSLPIQPQQQQQLKQQPQKQQPQSQQQQQSQQQRQQGQQNLGNANKDNNTPANVMSVLRLLTALENELGSLGPTANQLLGKAILYEKESKQSANELLHETEYFSLFATSLEKLKGLLSAGLVPDIKINATKTCVNDLEKILNLFEEYLRRNPDAPKNHLQSSIVLRKRQLASSESANTSSTPAVTNIPSNDNYNSKLPQTGQNVKNTDNNMNNDRWGGNQNQSNFNNKWNNDSEMRGSAGAGNRMGTNNGGGINSNNYDRQNVGQTAVGRGNYDSGNISDRQRNIQDNDYNTGNRSLGLRNDFSSNQRNMMSNNTRNTDHWETGNNQRNTKDDFNNLQSNNNQQQRRDNNMRGNDQYERDFSNKNNQRERNDFYNNNQRNDNNRFNSNQRDSQTLSNFNQRDSGNFNNRGGIGKKDDFSRNMGVGDNFNNRNTNSGDNFYQRSGNTDFNNQRNSGNYGNWGTSQLNQQNQQKNLPSLLNNNNFNESSNFSHSNNYGGGRGYGRR